MILYDVMLFSFENGGRVELREVARGEALVRGGPEQDRPVASCERQLRERAAGDHSHDVAPKEPGKDEGIVEYPLNKVVL